MTVQVSETSSCLLPGRKTALCSAAAAAAPRPPDPRSRRRRGAPPAPRAGPRPGSHASAKWSSLKRTGVLQVSFDRCARDARGGAGGNCGASTSCCETALALCIICEGATRDQQHFLARREALLLGCVLDLKNKREHSMRGSSPR